MQINTPVNRKINRKLIAAREMITAISGSLSSVREDIFVVFMDEAKYCKK